MRFYQFSLREMLIAVVAIGAVAALFVKNRPYAPTAFITALDERAMLEEVCDDSGILLHIGSMSRSYGMHGGGGQYRETSLVINEPARRQFQKSVLPDFRNRIEKVLQDSGCTIESRSQGGPDQTELQEFSFKYRFGTGRGVVRAYSLERSDPGLRLLIVADEW